MNKYDVLLNIIRDKILFILERYKHDYNITSSLSNLLFIFDSTYTSISKTILLLYLLLISKRSLISIVEEKTIQKINPLSKNKNIDILEIDVVVYYRLARDKNNKLFSLIINKNNIASLTLESFYSPYILINKLYFYESKRKYKKYYKSNILIYINKIEILIYKEFLVKLFLKYYNYINVFN